MERFCRNIQLIVVSFKAPFLIPNFFLLYNNDLSDDVICNIAILADDTTFYSMHDQASDLWHQLELTAELAGWVRKWLVDFDTEKTKLA